MKDTPNDLKYTESHEWLRANDDATVTIGITDHAQNTLGDVVFVDVEEPGTQVEAGEACGTIESVKSASDIFSPVDGDIIATNDTLEDAPGTVNDAPYGDGWLLRLKVEDATVLDDLMDADDYQAYCEQV